MMLSGTMPTPVACLHKPLDMEALLQWIEEILERTGTGELKGSGR